MQEMMAFGVELLSMCGKFNSQRESPARFQQDSAQNRVRPRSHAGPAIVVP